MKFIHLNTGAIKANTFIIYNEEKAVVIDPGGNYKRILFELESKNSKLEKILLTHGHFDHMGAVAQLKEATNAKVYIHSADQEMLKSNYANLSAYTDAPALLTEADIFLKDNDIIECAGEELQVLHTPGHTLGGVCFLTGKDLFSGDTLFFESIGRCDLAGGNFTQLIDSIKTKLLVLDDDVKVYPGHGEFTTIGHEKAYNPYLQSGNNK